MAEIELSTWKSERGPKALLILEAIGDNISADVAMTKRIVGAFMPEMAEMFKSPWQRPWVAEITGRSPKFKYERRFLKYTKDFEQANSKGSRGVRLFFLLESGRIYEAHEMCTWKRRRRYFCQVTSEGEIQEISEEQVQQWLSERTKNGALASTSTKLPSNA